MSGYRLQGSGVRCQVLSVLAGLVVTSALYAQQDTTSFFTPASSFNKKRLTSVLITEGALYGVTMVGLNSLWYKDYPRSTFHFFNDNNEWLQVDKVGHGLTSYYVGRLGIDVMRWTGVRDKRAIWYGGSTGFVFLTTIEILDGFSEQWGASPGDLLSNAAGTALVIGQELMWGEQRIVPKFSFHRTDLAPYRPSLLGNGFPEELIKDYNGQTYWLSFNLKSLFGGSEESRFPDWLNLAAGYGAHGMTGGSYNPPVYDEAGTELAFERYRQFYLSLDIDLTRIETKSKLLNSLFHAFGFIKIPAPALELNGVNGIQFYFFYF